MLAILRKFLFLLLGGFLFLTSLSQGYALGQAPATGQIVLCTGHGTFLITVDVDGNPTAPSHLCADCVVAALPAVDLPLVVLVAQTLSLAVYATGTDQRISPLFSSAAFARAPPVLV